MAHPTFDITADLPSGTTLLEASAGTGKTWTIAAVCTRALAEGRVRADELLVVTFSRSAARELRHRVHAMVSRSHRALVEGHGDPDDALVATLLRPEGREERRERLAAALDSFESATMTTIHEFASRLLAELGVLSDHDDTSHLVGVPRELVDQVARDLFLADHGGEPSDDVSTADDPQRPVDPQTWIDLAVEAALAHAPVDLPDEDPTRPRLAWAHRVRREVARRARRASAHTFDDLIADLAAALTDPLRGPDACRTLSRRFPLVLVDEFQDTDPLQWKVLYTAFHHHSDLWLIGDPKQSIYAFRGADVHAYLDASSKVDRTLVLDTNRRSDPAVVDAVGHLFGPVSMGDPRITVEPVTAHHTGSRLSCPRTEGHRYPWNAPVQLRWLGGPSTLPASESDRLVDVDLVNQVVMMVEGGSRWYDEDLGRERDLEPGDIAVLVRSHRRGSAIQRALVEAGQPAVFTGGASVWASPAAVEFADLLDALDDPDPTTVTRLALSRLIGGTPAQLARADSRLRPELALDLAAWARAWPALGPWGLLQSALHRPDAMTKVLRARDGERHLTDLRQVAQGAHEEFRARAGAMSPSACAQWLRDRAEDGGGETPRRLDTDRQAVTVSTVHHAKGLGFPVVLLPDAASSWHPGDRGQPVVWHDGNGRLLDVDSRGEQRARIWQIHEQEEAAEELRLLYVALTRARSGIRMWWTPSARRVTGSALHRLLSHDHLTPGDPGPGDDPRLDPSRLPWLDTALIDVVQVPLGQRRLTRTTSQEPPRLAPAREFTRSVDHDWGRTSYSALTAGLHGGAAGLVGQDLSDEPAEDPARAEAGGRSDAPLGPVEEGLAAPPTDPAAMPSGHDGSGVPGGHDGAGVPGGHDGAGESCDRADLCAMPGGTTFGSLVHAVLEHVDTSGPDLLGEVGEWTARLLADDPVEGVDAEDLARALTDVLHTDLGPLAPGLRLADVSPADRLPELDFELAMADHSRLAASVSDIAAALQDPALVDPADPLAGYGQVLGRSPAAPQLLAGFLTGSVDAVLRIPSGHHLVIDYKTNRAPVAPGATLTRCAYDPATMTSMMVESHYPLQALLYCAALHRFLASEWTGYDPDQHLGPVGYLFVRGMGPAPSSCPSRVVPGSCPAHPLVTTAPTTPTDPTAPTTPSTPAHPAGPTTPAGASGRGAAAGREPTGEVAVTEGPTAEGATMACGVFTWRPSPALVMTVSDLLGGRRAH